jgi:hypothetical protein
LGARLSQDALAVLSTRTEGWVAGLQLAALSVQEAQTPETTLAAIAGDNRHIADTRSAEVFQHQPTEIQDFIANSIRPDQCLPVTRSLAGCRSWLRPCLSASMRPTFFSRSTKTAVGTATTLLRLLRRLLDERYPGRPPSCTGAPAAGTGAAQTQ